MDQGPLTHTNGGNPQGDPYFGTLVYGAQNGGVPREGPPRGGLGPPLAGPCPGRGGPNYPPRVTVGI